MEEHIVSILGIEKVTHNVNRYTVSKPKGYKYIPGQATDVCVNKDPWKTEKRPFTFTSLNDWPHLEFTIKSYPEHAGVTDALSKCRAGDELILHDVWGAIRYAGEGVFLAGGAGVTPFIAIFRQLHQDHALGNNRLIFSNKTSGDIILEEEFTQMLKDRFINTLTGSGGRAGDKSFPHHKIDAAFLKEKITDWDQYFYICGPDPMVEGLQNDLSSFGVKKENIIVEQF